MSDLVAERPVSAEGPVLARLGSVSPPIAIGLLVTMYPVLAEVRCSETSRVAGDRRLLVASLVLNWVIGPALMFALAWLLLPDAPEHRTGLVVVGLARCIAMVLIWNDLSRGDREAAAVLVAINSRVPGPHLRGAGLVLPPGASRLAGPVHDERRLLRRRHRGQRARPPGHPAGRRLPHPHAGGASPRTGPVRGGVRAEDRPRRPLRPPLHHRTAAPPTPGGTR